ncbi:unnamed protein product [Notodromas monacha]|uniref:Uncharacterized protein n=1 Tax=Notodromas monacha TaxID=399045 RepID=A0A7R9C0D7_9CRUS|nr:unnamed protein product [Notodromas monacha]CAG0924996.1 unnamed protein product [Notodromas monacha]
MSGRGRGRNFGKPAKPNAWTEHRPPAHGRPNKPSTSNESKQNGVTHEKPSKFEEACARINRSNEGYIRSHGLSSPRLSDDEDNDLPSLNRSSILDSLLKRYDGDGLDDMCRTKQYLDDCLRGGDKIVCLICIDPVKKQEAV